MADKTVTFDDDKQLVAFWADLTLWQAAKYAADGDSYWLETELPIRAKFGMSTDDYWNMTVADHARMAEFVEAE